MKKKLYLRRAAALLCALLVCTALWAEAGQAALADKVIRLHVVANSDSESDQALKLKVRDAVLTEASALLSLVETREEAEAILRANLGFLSRTASETIRAAGKTDAVRVSLEKAWFPTKQYGETSLPAGTYEALRVVIGSGEGHNWWCVVFPSLCLASVSETSVPAMTGLSNSDYALVSCESQPYVIKFKVIEWWETLKHSAEKSVAHT